MNEEKENTVKTNGASKADNTNDNAAKINAAKTKAKNSGKTNTGKQKDASGKGKKAAAKDDPNYKAAMEHYVVTLRKDYKEKVVPALMKQFNYKSIMQVPKLEKIVINEGLGCAIQDKKIIDTAQAELTAITGQKAIVTLSRKDISNFKVRKKMPIGVCVTLRGNKMYEFLDRLIRVALPRIRDFKGISNKLDGRGNYTLGVQEQIIFPEINLDNVTRLIGMNITFVTSAKTDEEGYALLKEFGLPFKADNKN